MKVHRYIIHTFLLFILLVPSISYAGIVACAFQEIKHIYVNGDREDGLHPNRLLIELESPCDNGQSLLYLENSSAAYSSVLSTALMAFSTGTKVRIYVNSIQKNQIVVIEMKQ